MLTEDDGVLEDRFYAVGGRGDAISAISVSCTPPLNHVLVNVGP